VFANNFTDATWAIQPDQVEKENRERKNGIEANRVEKNGLKGKKVYLRRYNGERIGCSAMISASATTR